MSGRVIQGFFLGGRPKLSAVVVQMNGMSGVPAPAVAGHQPVAQARRIGPPASAFAARSVAQRRGPGDSFQVDPAQLGLASGGGRALPDAVRHKMEAALGADFSTVRVHVGPQAERIGAVAFTIGPDIYFAPGRFQPDTIHGQQLLGHELAHVVQQRAGRVRNPTGAGVAVVQDQALEVEADRLGQLAAAHPVAQPKSAPGQPKSAPAQPKSASGAMQPSSPVRISAPVGTGPGSYRLTAGAAGRRVGSVMVHARDTASVEVTDLGVDPAHRAHGIGRMLLASAARAGHRFGRSKVTLAAQDDGSGRLTQWYKGMGFAQVGVNQQGYPRLEAPISRVMAGVVQNHPAATRIHGPTLDPAGAEAAHGAAHGAARGAAIQRARTFGPGHTAQPKSTVAAGHRPPAPPPTRFASPSPVQRQSILFAPAGRPGAVLQKMEDDERRKKEKDTPPKHGRATKRNVEKNSAGRLHAVIKTREGSTLLHQYKQSRGYGGASLDKDELAHVFEGSGGGGGSRARGTRRRAAAAVPGRDIYELMNDYVGKKATLTATETNEYENELRRVIEQMLAAGETPAAVSGILDYYMYDGPLRSDPTLGLRAADFDSPYRR
jgi:ribosomal protein S18 acetylase RimI-like enzyme